MTQSIGATHSATLPLAVGYNANGPIRETGKRFMNPLDAKGYAELDTVWAPKLRSSSFCRIKSSTVLEIETGYNVVMQDSMAERVKAGSADLVHSRITAISALSDIQMDHSTVDSARGKSLRAIRSVILNACSFENEAVLSACKVLTKLNAEQIRATDCQTLGELEARSAAELIDCPEIGSLRSPKTNLIRCTVVKDIQTRGLKLKESSVHGTVTTANQVLHLQNCSIKNLIMKKPEVELNYSGYLASVPHELRLFVEKGLSGQLNVAQVDNMYMVKMPGGGYQATDIDVAAALMHIQRIQEEAAHAVVPGVEDQIVILSGGMVEMIYFEMERGTVYLENGAVVSEIRGGTSISEMGITFPGPLPNAFPKVPQEPPVELTDPIDLELMTDPYKLPDNPNIFDRRTLVRLADAQGNFLCPITRQHYNIENCFPDFNMKKTIEDWLKTHLPI